MPTLLLRLVGPMQSWGIASRFDQRDTGKEPSKSGVVGLIAAALGIDRANWIDLEPLAALTMGVRHDRPGIQRRDYQTAGCARGDAIITADGKPAKGGVVSHRFYLADAAFLVGLESEDRVLLERIHAALRNPFWPLALGRKSYMPSESIWMPDALNGSSMHEALANSRWIGKLLPWEKEQPARLLVSWESNDESGVLRMDQPLSSFAERRFGARHVRSEWVSLPQEDSNVSA